MGQLNIPCAIDGMHDVRTLVSVARALAPDDTLTPDEQAIVLEHRVDVPLSLLQAVSNAIIEGTDPLGTSYCNINSSLSRRGLGQTFTPVEAVIGMFKWAEDQGDIARIVDPGAGSGRYVLAGLRRHPGALGIAAEIDPTLALLLRANAQVLGVRSRLTLHVGDYRELKLPTISGRTLFVGNPPYVRHHEIATAWKAWYGHRLQDLGYASSRLAGLHLHFFLKTLELAKPGDLGCFITAAEWMDVNYGQALRDMLTNGLGGKAVFVVAPTVAVFSDAMTTACITCFAPGAADPSIEFKTIDRAEQLLDLSGGLHSHKAHARTQKRWSVLLQAKREPPQEGFVELGALFKVSRGQVTGHNKVWVHDGNPFGLANEYLAPSITDASEIVRAPNARIEDLRSLRRVVELPANLDDLPQDERKAIDEFLRWARSHGADQGYIARHRRPWWRVDMSRTPPIVMTYMGRRPPAFAINSAGARLINVAHGLYPRIPMSDDLIARFVRWLNENVSADSGRVYAGGLTKFEPGEAMRLSVPTPAMLETGRH